MKSKNNALQLDVVYTPDSDGGYTVSVPNLPGCISEGNTIEEAEKNIIEAIELYLEDITDETEIASITTEKHSLLSQISIPLNKLKLS